MNPRNRGLLPGMEERMSLSQLARRHTVAAVETVLGVMNNEEASDRDRISAANIILDRAWGKPLQAVDVKVESARDIPSLTRDVLLALAAGQVTDLEIELPALTVEETVDATE